MEMTQAASKPRTPTRDRALFRAPRNPMADPDTAGWTTWEQGDENQETGTTDAVLLENLSILEKWRQGQEQFFRNNPHTSAWDQGREQFSLAFWKASSGYLDVSSTPEVGRAAYSTFAGCNSRRGRHTVYGDLNKPLVPIWAFVESSRPSETDSRFQELLDELNEVDKDALEEGFELPSDLAKTNADRLLREMFDILPRQYDIYTTHDREIAISLPNRRGSSVILLCRSNGGALCLVDVPGIPERSRSYTPEESGQLPDGFLRMALLRLDEMTDGWTW